MNSKCNILFILIIILLLYLFNKNNKKKIKENFENNYVTDIFSIKNNENCSDIKLDKSNINRKKVLRVGTKIGKDKILTGEDLTIESGVELLDGYKLCQIKDKTGKGITKLYPRTVKGEENVDDIYLYKEQSKDTEGNKINHVKSRSKYLGCYENTTKDFDDLKSVNFKTLEKCQTNLKDDETKNYLGMSISKNENVKISDEELTHDGKSKSFCKLYETKPNLKRIKDIYCSSIMNDNVSDKSKDYLGGFGAIALYQKNHDSHENIPRSRTEGDNKEHINFKDLINMKNNLLVYCPTINNHSIEHVGLDNEIENENKKYNIGLVTKEDDNEYILPDITVNSSLGKADSITTSDKINRILTKSFKNNKTLKKNIFKDYSGNKNHIIHHLNTDYKGIINNMADIKKSVVYLPYEATEYILDKNNKFMFNFDFKIGNNRQILFSLRNQYRNWLSFYIEDKTLKYSYPKRFNTLMITDENKTTLESNENIIDFTKNPRVFEKINEETYKYQGEVETSGSIVESDSETYFKLPFSKTNNPSNQKKGTVLFSNIVPNGETLIDYNKREETDNFKTLNNINKPLNFDKVEDEFNFKVKKIIIKENKTDLFEDIEYNKVKNFIEIKNYDLFDIEKKEPINKKYILQYRITGLTTKKLKKNKVTVINERAEDHIKLWKKTKFYDFKDQAANGPYNKERLFQLFLHEEDKKITNFFVDEKNIVNFNKIVIRNDSDSNEQIKFNNYIYDPDESYRAKNANSYTRDHPWKWGSSQFYSPQTRNITENVVGGYRQWHLSRAWPTNYYLRKEMKWGNYLGIKLEDIYKNNDKHPNIIGMVYRSRLTTYNQSIRKARLIINPSNVKDTNTIRPFFSSTHNIDSTKGADIGSKFGSIDDRENGAANSSNYDLEIYDNNGTQITGDDLLKIDNIKKENRFSDGSEYEYIEFDEIEEHPSWYNNNDRWKPHYLKLKLSNGYKVKINNQGGFIIEIMEYYNWPTGNFGFVFEGKPPENTFLGACSTYDRRDGNLLLYHIKEKGLKKKISTTENNGVYFNHEYSGYTDENIEKDFEENKIKIREAAGGFPYSNTNDIYPSGIPISIADRRFVIFQHGAVVRGKWLMTPLGYHQLYNFNTPSSTTELLKEYENSGYIIDPSSGWQIHGFYQTMSSIVVEKDISLPRDGNGDNFDFLGDYLKSNSTTAKDHKIFTTILHDRSGYNMRFPLYNDEAFTAKNPGALGFTDNSVDSIKCRLRHTPTSQLYKHSDYWDPTITMEIEYLTKSDEIGKENYVIEWKDVPSTNDVYDEEIEIDTFLENENENEYIVVNEKDNKNYLKCQIEYRLKKISEPDTKYKSIKFDFQSDVESYIEYQMELKYPVDKKDDIIELDNKNDLKFKFTNLIYEKFKSSDTDPTSILLTDIKNKNEIENIEIGGISIGKIESIPRTTEQKKYKPVVPIVVNVDDFSADYKPISNIKIKYNKYEQQECYKELKLEQEQECYEDILKKKDDIVLPENGYVDIVLDNYDNIYLKYILDKELYNKWYGSTYSTPPFTLDVEYSFKIYDVKIQTKKFEAEKVFNVNKMKQLKIYNGNKNILEETKTFNYNDEIFNIIKDDNDKSNNWFFDFKAPNEDLTLNTTNSKNFKFVLNNNKANYKEDEGYNINNFYIFYKLYDNDNIKRRCNIKIIFDNEDNFSQNEEIILANIEDKNKTDESKIEINQELKNKLKSKKNITKIDLIITNKSTSTINYKVDYIGYVINTGLPLVLKFNEPQTISNINYVDTVGTEQNYFLKFYEDYNKEVDNSLLDYTNTANKGDVTMYTSEKNIHLRDKEDHLVINEVSTIDNKKYNFSLLREDDKGNYSLILQKDKEEKSYKITIPNYVIEGISTDGDIGETKKEYINNIVLGSECKISYSEKEETKKWITSEDLKMGNIMLFTDNFVNKKLNKDRIPEHSILFNKGNSDELDITKDPTVKSKDDIRRFKTPKEIYDIISEKETLFTSIKIKTSVFPFKKYGRNVLLNESVNQFNESSIPFREYKVINIVSDNNYVYCEGNTIKYIDKDSTEGKNIDFYICSINNKHESISFNNNKSQELFLVDNNDNKVLYIDDTNNLKKYDENKFDNSIKLQIERDEIGTLNFNEEFYIKYQSKYLVFETSNNTLKVVDKIVDAIKFTFKISENQVKKKEIKNKDFKQSTVEGPIKKKFSCKCPDDDEATNLYYKEDISLPYCFGGDYEDISGTLTEDEIKKTEYNQELHCYKTIEETNKGDEFIKFLSNTSEYEPLEIKIDTIGYKKSSTHSEGAMSINNDFTLNF